VRPRRGLRCTACIAALLFAPEYRLAVTAPSGKVRLTYRDEWMRNTRAFEHQSYAAVVVEVAIAGDTAVALVHGLWTVKRGPDRPAQALRFVATDTWVRRVSRRLRGAYASWEELGEDFLLGLGFRAAA
jgi:hypothetical protein